MGIANVGAPPLTIEEFEAKLRDEQQAQREQRALTILAGLLAGDVEYVRTKEKSVQTAFEIADEFQRFLDNETTEES